MPIGLYLHVPFCASKCPYCDFYSVVSTPEVWDAYTAALCNTITEQGALCNTTADTLYLGGGTPSLLGAQRLTRILRAARQAFHVTDTAEITLEANPGDDLAHVFAAFAAEGGNRISLGMQATDNTHLRTLGRRHTTEETEAAVRCAQQAGITNISLDLMLGTPHQTAANVRDAVARCTDWGATHVSAYLLKLEPGTPFGTTPPPIPNEDETIALYHTAAEALEQNGYRQYEISNFAHTGFESRHNIKYWNLDPYLGLGPSAHSFFGGKRFAYPRDLSAFIAGNTPLAENDEPTAIAEGSPEEYAMLRLRLTAGLSEADFHARYGKPLPEQWVQRAAALPSSLITCDENGIRLTREGFLVSNAVISHLLGG